MNKHAVLNTTSAHWVCFQPHLSDREQRLWMQLIPKCSTEHSTLFHTDIAKVLRENKKIDVAPNNGRKPWICRV